MTDNLPGVSPVAQDDDLANKTISNNLNDANQVAGGVAKEQMESRPMGQSESAPIVELSENERVPEEVESWVEKLERGEDIKLPQPVTHDDQVLVSSSDDLVDEAVTILPLSQKEASEGLTKKVYSSARWLAEWCVRVAKKLHGHVVYRTSELEKEASGTT